MRFNKPLLMATLLSSVGAYASTYDPDSNILTVDSIVVGNITYANVTTKITPAELTTEKNDSTAKVTSTTNSYDPATGLATFYFVQNLKTFGTNYTNVKINLSGNTFNVGCATPTSVGAPNDPLFGDQWHLRNIGQQGNNGVPGTPGADLNLSTDPAWKTGQGGISTVWSQTTGCGIQIAVVDDGVDRTHEDLNVNNQKSIDFAKGTPKDTSVNGVATGINQQPGQTGAVGGSHGTATAGLAAAKGNNGIGVAGVAYNASVVDYNYLANPEDAYLQASANNVLAGNHIYNNSWGPSAVGFLSSSPMIWQTAINASNQGERAGLGAVHLFAAGNGFPDTRSDYSGFDNYQGVFAIASLNDQDKKASYSQLGADLLVSAYGGEFCDSHTMTTTDVTGALGYNSQSANANVNDYTNNLNYTKCYNGTSAATPVASGVVALLLQANSALSWRDVRRILATTARKVDSTNSDWIQNGAGYWVNHSYGYGAINASAAVQAAKGWISTSLLPAQKTSTQSTAPNTPIADGAANGCGAATTSTITLANTGINNIEFVDVTPTSDHTEFGDLKITLNSPSNSFNPTGTPSTFADTHVCKDASGANVPCGAQLANGFRFGSARLLGEKADGNWTLSIQDCKAGNTGSLQSWAITVYGY